MKRFSFLPFFQFFLVTSEYVENVDEDVELRGVSEDGTVVATGVVDSDVVCEVSNETVFGKLVVVVVLIAVVVVIVVGVVELLVIDIFDVPTETADFLGILLENFLKNFFFGFFALFFFPAVELLSLFFVQSVVD